MTMRFEVYTEMQAPEGVDHYKLYWNTMKQVEYADQMGYEVFSSIDHQWFPRFGISANPLAFWSAAAQRTRRIRFRTLLHNTSLHNPMVLASHITAADILTQGRLELGLGRGHAWIFPKASIPLENAKPRSVEAMEILRKGFSQESFDHDGEYFDVENVRIVPRPYQQQYKIYIGGTSDSTYEEAGEKGWGLVVPPLLPHKQLEEQFGIYREACERNGNRPDIVFIHAVYMDEDETRIREEAAEALHGFLANNAAPTGELPPKEELEAKGFGFYASGILESLAQMSYEEITEQEVVWVGSPQRIIEYIEKVQEEVEGLGAIAIVPNYGGIEHWKSIKTMQIFAEEVMPYFRKKQSEVSVADG
jgi:alkanesulfonate monooxygenase SsuD/methylene tetrahydromethanopterin reductase-like flavin-dependent oxidoreductase (luciferase family)